MADERYDPGNVFAKILRGEIPAFKVYEDERTLSFMDAMPQSEGHTLVIPKTNACNLFDIEPEALANLIKVTQRIAVAVRKAFDAPGMRIVQFNGAVAGQTVFHIHFHIIPWYQGLELKHHAREWGDKAVLTQHAERIKKALADA